MVTPDPSTRRVRPEAGESPDTPAINLPEEPYIVTDAVGINGCKATIARVAIPPKPRR
jgi:hypothetical protein